MSKPMYLVLSGAVLGVIAFLLWMLFSVQWNTKTKVEAAAKPRAHCPLCGHPLEKGERVRSSVTEIGNVEVRTRIKGCSYCIDGKSTRRCPVCKKALEGDAAVIAFSDPRVDRKKLRLKGCPSCFPEGFT